MRRIAPLTAMMVVALLTLSGCFKADMDLEVHSDNTISGTMIAGIDKDLSAMAEQSTDEMFPAEELPPGASAKDWSDDKYVGQQVTFDNVTIEELSDTTDGNEGFQLVREGDTFIFDGEMDLSMLEDEGTGNPEDQLVGKMAEVMAQEVDVRVSFTFPGDVTNADDAAQVDGNTVTWRPKAGENLKMHAEAPAEAGLAWGLIALVGGGLLVLLAVVAGVVALRRRPAQPTAEPEPLV